MLVAIIYLVQRVGGGNFDYATILSAIQSGRTTLSSAEELWLFLAFFIAFAIKVPLFPLHTWLPERARGSAHGRLRHAGFASC